MLFGNENLRKKIIEDAEKFANTFNGRIIYGAVCGSISKGFQTRSSDYDTRFLYINEDFPNKILCPRELPETEIIKRYYTDGKAVPYEWIPCWEATSFFQYLVEPYIEGKLSYGLYNTVGWTLQSPYAWDPFGIQQKIIPLINDIFEKTYSLRYYIRLLEDLWENADGIYFPKDYIFCVYTAAQINWVINKNSFPPVNGDVLLYFCASDNVREEVRNVCEENQPWKQEKITASENVTAFVQDMFNCAKLITNTSVSKHRKNEVVNEIYQIIYRSVFHEQSVNNVNDFEAKQLQACEERWAVFMTIPDNVLLQNGFYEISVRTQNDCRRMRILLHNNNDAPVCVKKVTIQNNDLCRVVTVNCKESFTLNPGCEMYSDDILAWLCFSEFKIIVELDDNINGENSGIIKQLEEWVYEHDGDTSSSFL